MSARLSRPGLSYVKTRGPTRLLNTLGIHIVSKVDHFVCAIEFERAADVAWNFEYRVWRIGCQFVLHYETQAGGHSRCGLNFKPGNRCR